MHDAFISYARSDSREFVARLAPALEAAGKDVFVDLEDIPPASRWERDLREGIAASAVFAFVISPGSVASEHCRRELDHAREANKRIVPIAYLEVPDEQVPAAVAQLNWVPQQGVFEDDFDGALAKLIEAFETDAEALRDHARWQQRAEAWRDGDRAKGLLATGAELREADAWLEAQTGRKPEPTPIQAEWVAAGRRSAVRRQSGLFSAAIVALLISAALGVLALIQRNEAIDQRETARADELASDSTANLESDPELSLILAREAARTKATDRSESVLRRALLASHVRARIESEDAAPIDTAVFSPDDSLLAVAIEDGTVRICDADTGETIATLDTGADYASDAVFVPDGDRLLTSDSNGKVITWSVPEGTRLSEFQGASSGILNIDVSPDGDSVAVGAQGEATIFDLEGGSARSLEGIRDRVNSVEFSPDSQRVITASKDPGSGVTIWDAEDGARLQRLGRDSGLDAEYSPTGKFIATANGDGSASIWAADSGAQIGDPLQASGRGFINRVAWVPQGDAVITGGQGSGATAWDVNSRAPIDVYRGHAGFILDVGTDASGNRMATAGSDGTARIWDVGLRTATIPSPAATTLEFTADGERLLYADGLGEIVDARAGTVIGRASTNSIVFATALAPDGRRFAAAENGGRAEIFDLRTGKPIGAPLDSGAGRMFTVGWSADGSRLLAAGATAGVTVWDTDSGEEVGSIPVTKDREQLFGAALSADGTQVVTISGGAKAKIFDVETGEVVGVLDGHSAAINSIAFDRAGSRILTASADGTARVWDADDLSQLLTLNNDGDPVRGATFSGDGQLIATTGVGGELRVWDADSGLELASLEGVDFSPALSQDGSEIAAADTFSGQVSIYECDVCEADTSRLVALADQRITREPTEQERALYLEDR
jgi:WD40 repeat protein